MPAVRFCGNSVNSSHRIYVYMQHTHTHFQVFNSKTHTKSRTQRNGIQCIINLKQFNQVYTKIYSMLVYLVFYLFLLCFTHFTSLKSTPYSYTLYEFYRLRMIIRMHKTKSTIGTFMQMKTKHAHNARDTRDDT